MDNSVPQTPEKHQLVSKQQNATELQTATARQPLLREFLAVEISNKSKIAIRKAQKAAN